MIGCYDFIVVLRRQTLLITAESNYTVSIIKFNDFSVKTLTRRNKRSPAISTIINLSKCLSTISLETTKRDLLRDYIFPIHLTIPSIAIARNISSMNELWGPNNR